MKKKKNNKTLLIKPIVLAGVLSLLFPLSVKSESKKINPTGSDPVITIILGTGLRIHRKPTDAMIENAAESLAKAGFSLTWAASPAASTKNILNKPAELAHEQKVAAVFRKHGIGIAYGLHWHSLLPVRSKTNAPLFGEVLDPKTGDFGTIKSRRGKREKWNYGSEKALQEFARRAKMLLKKIGPIEMFYADEITLARPGKGMDKRISTYCSSPTYSREALEAFRKYLAEKKFPGAEKAKFPVTTIAAKPSKKANMGLPAIKIGNSNKDRLVEDNNWPHSKLWKHWYKWRVQIYTRWLDTITTLAYEANKKNKNWLGGIYEMPVHWMVPELGQDLKQIVKLPHVNYVVAGYTTGQRYAKVKKIADAAGKKWGLQVEVSRYRRSTGMPVDYIEKTFKGAVKDGASLITCYAGSSLITSNVKVSKGHRKNGWYYMPEQAKTWNSCIDWLKNTRGVKKLKFKK
jgi:hypothetical protein